MKMLPILKSINYACGKMIKYFLIACIGAQTGIVFLGVVFRYVFADPLSWSDELSTFLMIYLTFFGCYAALEENQLARIELLITKLKGRWKNAIVITGYFVTLAFVAVVLYFGTTLYFSFSVQKQLSAAMRIPLKIFYISIPIGMMMMIFRICITILETITFKANQRNDPRCS